jgi:tryptophan 7-halogenase
MKRIVIVGGGTAGWITAAYLARTLGAQSADGISITLVESADIGILGVGEGTFPTIRKTLRRIGIDETALIRDCDATFKQGAKFVNWRFVPQDPRHNHYLHSFQVTQDFGGLDLLSYWLLGVAGEELNWDEVNTPQKPVADANRAPKLITHENFTAPLNYAYHVDAMKLARFLRTTAIGLGVTHVVDTVESVALADDGSIGSLKLKDRGVLAADLYVDCTGFRAELIGKALGIPYKSSQPTLFCDTALAAQVPYAEPSTPIPSYTISTAQEAGWIWDIGLHARRGVGYVYSSAHISREAAETTLRNYLGPHARTAEARDIRFTSGYRETNWHKNCVAIGLSSGFFEPLEATGIIFVEVAAAMLANLFPWGGEVETAARQYNAIMLKRFERARDFIKMHYSLTERRDTDFWRDNANSTTSPDSLLELIDRWRFRAPGAIDIDLNTDLFTEHSWQYVLYGMGFRTDLRPKRSAFRFFNEAHQAFLEVRRQAVHALETLPTNRELIEQARTRRFGSLA